IWAAIDDPTKHVVIQTAPAPRSAIGECFGLPAGTPLTFEMNTAMRYCGFDKVFDTNFSADLTIIEEGTELILRLYKALVKKEPVSLPLFTSCSPGWVKYIEHFYPEMLSHLSSAKSPQQMFGAVIKTYYAELNNIDPADIVTVALMPCTAKKFECNRPEMNSSGFKDIDYGLTTRELAGMFQEAGIDLPNMPKSDFDEPFGTRTGSGVIFGATGGVMESAIRTVYELITGDRIDNLFERARIMPVRGFEGIRYAELPIAKVGPVPDLLKHLIPNWDWLRGATLKVAVAHGTANAKKVLDNIKSGGKLSECHFIEFMACPGGCLGGGGMPIPTNEEIRAARARAIYAEDEASEVRKSYENPAVVRLYNEFLVDGPCGHKSHKLLHTYYTPRGKKLV
nr:iron hydrogenase small subunit [Candidatus Neomarinimicrobiota bacterium]